MVASIDRDSPYLSTLLNHVRKLVGYQMLSCCGIGAILPTVEVYIVAVGKGFGT
nr:hypothetical protein [Porphyromonas endodontalis]